MQVYTLIINRLIQAARRGFLSLLLWITCKRSGVYFSCWSVSRITTRSKSGARTRTHTRARINTGRRGFTMHKTTISRLKPFLGVLWLYPYIIPFNHKKPLKSLLGTLKRAMWFYTPYRPGRVAALPELFRAKQPPQHIGVKNSVYNILWYDKLLHFCY